MAAPQDAQVAARLELSGAVVGTVASQQLEDFSRLTTEQVEARMREALEVIRSAREPVPPQAPVPVDPLAAAMAAYAAELTARAAAGNGNGGGA